MFGWADNARVIINGRTIYLDLLDSRVLTVFGEMSEYGLESVVLARAIHQGDTFLDIGANHGSFSLLARDRVGESGSVIAFEPQPRLAMLLQRSFEANGFSNCVVHNLALHERTGTMELFIPATGSGSAGLYERFSATGAYQRATVEVAPFDQAVEWQRLPGKIFMKIDAEGSELAIIAGAEQMLRQRRPEILLELNPTSATAAGYSVRELLERLFDFGYTHGSELDQYPRGVPLRDLDDSRQRNVIIQVNSIAGR
ncbi:MAG TPA: FkbM family methyltransferase [Candidatus Binataceae bacterium]|nr:FkbM family methyltransferase [Candidatus Binataceae bacterium]